MGKIIFNLKYVIVIREGEYFFFEPIEIGIGGVTKSSEAKQNFVSNSPDFLISVYPPIEFIL